MKLLFILLIVVLVGCGAKSAAPVSAATTAPSVRLGVVEAVEARQSLAASATFAAIDSAELSPETEGVVREVFVRLGDVVSAGQPLLRIEAREAQWRLDESKARVSEMQAALRQAEARLGGEGQKDSDLSAEVLSAQSSVDGAEEEFRLAEIEEGRAARLRATKDISQSSYERAKSTLLGTQARLRGARQQLAAVKNAGRQATQAIAMARAQLESAQAQAAQAQKRAGDTTLRAPFAGVITGRTISVGEYVGPQSKPLRLDRTDPLKLVFQLPESQAGKVRPGMEVEARLTALPEQVFEGRLRAPNGALDASSRALVVEAEFANAQRLLKPGFFAEGKIFLGGTEARLRLPKAALDFDPRTETYRVWSFQKGNVKLHLVGVPARQGATVELAPMAGLGQGTQVVLDPPANLFDGMAVTTAEKQ